MGWWDDKKSSEDQQGGYLYKEKLLAICEWIGTEEVLLWVVESGFFKGNALKTEQV